MTRGPEGSAAGRAGVTRKPSVTLRSDRPSRRRASSLPVGISREAPAFSLAWSGSSRIHPSGPGLAGSTRRTLGS